MVVVIFFADDAATWPYTARKSLCVRQAWHRFWATTLDSRCSFIGLARIEKAADAIPRGPSGGPLGLTLTLVVGILILAGISISAETD